MPIFLSEWNVKIPLELLKSDNTARVPQYPTQSLEVLENVCLVLR